MLLRLVNKSPYLATGAIVAAGVVKDLVYETRLPSTDGRTHPVTLLPNDIRSFSIPQGRRERVHCRFAFAPEIAAKVFRRAETVLGRATLPPDKARQLRTAQKAKDAFAVYNMLVDCEVLDCTRSALKEPVPWP